MLMTAPILAATSLCLAATIIHVVSITVAALRLRRPAPHYSCLAQALPSVSLVRPLCGIDNHAAETLRSTFTLDDANCEILFCVASANDPVVPLVRGLMAEYPSTNARLLIGDEPASNNPKLNNVLKGWRAAQHEWIVLADANVLMPPDYLRLLFASWRADTGLVASPPIGSRPRGIWAEVECAFLNTYQARWQYLADMVGFGFAQGKTMLWRRADLEQAGGIEALAKEVAEDAAATKIVRAAGRKVRLAAQPFAQPLGRRSASEVWNRQLRWARLRRASFFGCFLPEALAGGLLPLVLLAAIAPTLGVPRVPSVISLGILWYGGEMLLASIASWHLSLCYPLACLLRDLLLPVLFVKALSGDNFAWRGNEMRVARPRPRQVMAHIRPRIATLAPVARRRLRSLRARMS
jgi:ceramide glucosyltransferase